MSTRRRLAILTIAASWALGLSAPVGAQAPEPADDGEPVEDVEQVPVETLPGEVVHSWALGPAGSADATGAGNRSNLSYTADPGATINDAITLYNLGNVPLTFRVYATDAFNNDLGEFNLLPGDEEPTDVGSWVSLDIEEITVPPRVQATIPFTLVVPDDARPGDHTGAILASSEALGAGEGGDSIVLDRRTGTRLFLRVNGPITSELAISELETSYDATLNPAAGTATVSYRIENRGDVRVSGTTTLTVGGPFGIGERKVPSQEFESLLPGEGFNVTTVVEDAPALGLAFTEVTVEPDPSDGQLLEPVSRTTTTFAPPITVLLLLLAALLGWIGWRAVRRHRDRADSAELDVEIEVEPELEPEAQPT